MGLLRGLVGVGRGDGAAGRRVEGRRRQTVAGTPGALDAAGLGVDLELVRLPQRQLVQDGVHSMALDGGDGTTGADGRPWYSKLMTMDGGDPSLHFYKSKVLPLQEQAGTQDNAPIAGNLYSYLALRAFGDSSELFQGHAGPLLLLGLYCIVVIQVFGPACILYRVYFQTSGIGNVGFHNWKYEPGSDTHGLSYLGSRIIGLLFITLFMLNGTYVLKRDQQEARKIVEISAVFRRAADAGNYLPPNEAWLWVGACVNVWCLLLCGICMWPLLLTAEGPKDVIFDALGLTFLYNMDDISGDFGFIDEKWDEDQFGDIYGALAKCSDLMQTFRRYREDHFTPDNIYSVGKWLAFLLLALLPLAFAFVELEVNDGEAGGRRLTEDLEDLRASNELLRAQLAALNATVASLLPL